MRKKAVAEQGPLCLTFVKQRDSGSRCFSYENKPDAIPQCCTASYILFSFLYGKTMGIKALDLRKSVRILTHIFESVL